ncbi:S24/S26 family peptidase [Cellulomonas sp.]|uniref:S24/S26 family peptidase n=1 Tax=Cellulomonas sp. TaxID=40001 RepID=UPI001B147828|nr:S24/S26 family peptidase [Cellulomonas sp.]MBO9553032.1 S24/S26 family peptidase [Cellulomonas sp.]
MDQQVDTAAPGAHVARRVLRVVLQVLFYGAVVVAGWLVWPTSLGGCTTLTVVSGHSMEPTYYTGDLVVSRCATPQVGDVVVYEPEGYGGARVIHRLVGGDGTHGWQVQGDNNSWLDPFSPTDADVVGVARLHVPRVGLLGRAVMSPLVWGSLIVIAIGLLVWPRGDDDDDETPDAPEAGRAPDVTDGVAGPVVDTPVSASPSSTSSS